MSLIEDETKLKIKVATGKQVRKKYFIKAYTHKIIENKKIHEI